MNKPAVRVTGAWEVFFVFGIGFPDEVCVSFKVKRSTVQVVKDSVILLFSVAVSTVRLEVWQYCLVTSSLTDDSSKVVFPSSILLSISFAPSATTSSCNKLLEQCTDLCIKLTLNRLSRFF